MSRRHVSISLTPWAPGVEGAAIGDRRRWIAMWSVTPAQALADLCLRLERSAQAVYFRAAHDDIEILGRVAGEADPVVLALVGYGLSVSDLDEARAQLTGHKVAA